MSRVSGTRAAAAPRAVETTPDALSGEALPASTAGPRPIERPLRLMEAVVEQLRSLILNGELAPGMPLRQQDLAEQLGVSRTPLREALLRLEREGLVETSTSGVSRVVELSGAAAIEILDVREVVDGLAARLMAERGLDAEERAQLDQYLAAMEDANGRDDKHGYLVANTAFHLQLLTGPEHRRLEQFTTLIQMSCQATYLQRQHQTDRLRSSAGEHRGIVEAIAARDPDAAEACARAHIRSARRHWVGAGPSRAAAGDQHV